MPVKFGRSVSRLAGRAGARSARAAAGEIKDAEAMIAHVELGDVFGTPPDQFDVIADKRENLIKRGVKSGQFTREDVSRAGKIGGMKIGDKPLKEAEKFVTSKAAQKVKRIEGAAERMFARAEKAAPSARVGLGQLQAALKAFDKGLGVASVVTLPKETIKKSEEAVERVREKKRGFKLNRNTGA